MLEALCAQEWTLMEFSKVKESLVEQGHDFIICEEHKTAEVGRSAQKTNSNTYKGRGPMQVVANIVYLYSDPYIYISE